MKNFSIPFGMICSTIILFFAACDNGQRQTTTNPTTVQQSNVPEATATIEQAEHWIGDYDPKGIGPNIWISRAALEQILKQEGVDGLYIKEGIRADQSQVELAWSSFDTLHTNSVPDVVYQLQLRNCICRPCCPPDPTSDSAAATTR